MAAPLPARHKDDRPSELKSWLRRSRCWGFSVHILAGRRDMDRCGLSSVVCFDDLCRHGSPRTTISLLGCPWRWDEKAAINENMGCLDLCVEDGHHDVSCWHSERNKRSDYRRRTDFKLQNRAMLKWALSTMVCIHCIAGYLPQALVLIVLWFSRRFFTPNPAGKPPPPVYGPW